MAIKRVDCHAMWMKSKGVKISIFTSAYAWHYLKWNFETSSWTLFFHSCSKWKVCARAKANRTDILQSKCSMIKQYGWTVQALDLLPSSSRPALDHRSEILFQRSLEFKFLTTAVHEFSIDIITFEGLLAKNYNKIWKLHTLSSMSVIFIT